MDLQVTEEALGVLRRSIELAGLDSTSTGIRLRGSRGLGGGFDVQVELAREAAADEEKVTAGGLTFFVDPEIARVVPDPVVTVEPQHEVVVVRPSDAR